MQKRMTIRVDFHAHYNSIQLYVLRQKPLLSVMRIVILLFLFLTWTIKVSRSLLLLEGSLVAVKVGIVLLLPLLMVNS